MTIEVSFHVRLEEEFFVAYFALVPHVACVLSLVLLQVMTLAVDFAAIRKLAGEALRLPIANTRHSLTLIFTLLYFQGLFSFQKSWNFVFLSYCARIMQQDHMISLKQVILGK